MRTIKTDIELKEEFWSQEDKGTTPAIVAQIIEHYGDKPATTPYLMKSSRWKS